MARELEDGWGFPPEPQGELRVWLVKPQDGGLLLCDPLGLGLVAARFPFVTRQSAL